ncbi:MAG: hypothetical protein ACKOCM_11010 [Cyanobacteriota bacterium]
MGLLDRLLGSKPASVNPKPAAAKQKTDEEAFFLDPEASSSMGNVDFMRRSNTIRRTFPGSADNPGFKEMIQEVASMEARVEKLSPGLPGSDQKEVELNLTGGIPKPVKKTFAEKLSEAELNQRMKGSAVGVNVTGGPAVIQQEKAKAAKAAEEQPAITSQTISKPGSIDAFKSMAKDLNA